MLQADVLIIGAGIVGAACAREFARRGLSVAVVEQSAPGGGATAASMGHLLVVDAEGSSDDHEYQLSRRSMQLWGQWLAESGEHEHVSEFHRCGTLWLAADDEEWQLAQRKARWLQSQGMNAELLGLAEAASQVYQPGGFVIDGLKQQLDAVPTREQMIGIMADMIAEAPEDSFMSAKSVSPTKRYIGLMGITLMSAVKKTTSPPAPAPPLPSSPGSLTSSTSAQSSA